LTDVWSDRFVASDIEDASVFYCNRTSDGIFRVNGNDLSLGEDETRGFRSGLYACGPGDDRSEGEPGYFEKFPSVYERHGMTPSITFLFLAPSFGNINFL
jgi:hypothetical protein